MTAPNPDGFLRTLRAVGGTVVFGLLALAAHGLWVRFGPHHARLLWVATGLYGLLLPAMVQPWQDR